MLYAVLFLSHLGFFIITESLTQFVLGYIVATSAVIQFILTEEFEFIFNLD